jgi:hypothetical protein
MRSFPSCKSHGLFRVRRIAAVLIAVVAMCSITLTASGAPASLTHARFVSPSRNISCEMADEDARGSFVHCQSKKLPHSVRMTRTGRLKLCRGVHCLGDPATNTRVLGYTERITVGRFQCISQHAGVTCTVIRPGKGFLIDKTRVHRVGGTPSRATSYRSYQLMWPSRPRQSVSYALTFNSGRVREITLRVYGIPVPRGLGSFIVGCMHRGPATLSWDWIQSGRTVRVRMKMTSGECFPPGPQLAGTMAPVYLSIVT